MLEISKKKINENSKNKTPNKAKPDNGNQDTGHRTKKLQCFLRIGKQMRWTLSLPQFTAWREFPGCSTEREKPMWSSSDCPSLGDRTESIRKPRYLGLIYGINYQKVERAAQKENAGNLKCSHLSIQQTAWMWENYPRPGIGGKPKGLGRATPSDHTRPRSNACLWHLEWKNS